MSIARFTTPIPTNEPVRSYAPGTEDRKKLKEAIKDLRSKVLDIPMYIGGKEVRTENKVAIRCPHDTDHILAYYHKGDASHVEMAIQASLNAKAEWESLPWEQRAAIFLKMANLLAGPFRYKMNAATMLGQSKNAYQAEIDATCELIDFFKFNVKYMEELLSIQPGSGHEQWNRSEYRALEGFVFALTPFNFTSIAGNLPTAPAMMGNTVVWKASEAQIYSAQVLMELFQASGLPDGVINLVHAGGRQTGDVVFAHPEFAGIHFTGSTGVFQTIWQTIGNNIMNYRSYPRIVGETGGKDFVIAHHTADPELVAVALSRGSFEFQGQKCSAASRAYIPSNIWPEVKEMMFDHLRNMKMGPPENFTNFINAVINEAAFDTISSYIDRTNESDKAEVIYGGSYDKSNGYFIEPTVILSKDPQYLTMCEEIFGPVLTIYVYEEDQFEETLVELDNTSPYALTGAIFAEDRYAIDLASEVLRHSAGNFYINDKPTGAVVGQQPFGGARGSGTNDKAGSIFNLIRWTSMRTIKETLNPARDWKYPFHSAE